MVSRWKKSVAGGPADWARSARFWGCVLPVRCEDSYGMVMIGTDSHKRTHTVVAVDDVGRRLGVKTVRTNSEGIQALERECGRR